MIDPPLYIASEIYRHSRYGVKHPLSIPRVSTATDLSRALGWLPDAQYRDGPVATPQQLARFHDPDYIDALQRAEREGLSDEEQVKWNIGRGGNPIYPEVFRRPATAAGSSILAANMLSDGGVIHNPAGGTHHGRRNQASGFCYLNDPVLGILTFLDRGHAPVAYVDLDAHHGDGVEDAFLKDHRVTTMSIHEGGRWPHGGHAVHDHGPSVINIPVMPGFNDSEFFYVLETVILPILSDLSPAAIVLQCGVDGLVDDPLSKLSLSNSVYWSAAAEIQSLTPRLLVLGGGGYNPYTVARAWAGIWGTLNGHEFPDKLPDEARELLEAIPWQHSLARNPPKHWFETLTDPPALGPIREDTRHIVRDALRLFQAG